MKTLLVGAAVLIAGPAVAQDLSPNQSGASVRTSHITATGETVPNPGMSQSGGTTPLDRGIQAEDNKIDNSICKGC
jgi:hypothetical protein